MVKRVIILLVLGVGAAIGVTAYNRQRASNAIKEDMLQIVAGIDCDEADHRYLATLVERFHPAIIKTALGDEGRRLDDTAYLQAMFDRLIQSADEDGKSAEVIAGLESSRDDHVSVSRSD